MSLKTWVRDLFDWGVDADDYKKAEAFVSIPKKPTKYNKHTNLWGKDYYIDADSDSFFNRLDSFLFGSKLGNTATADQIKTELKDIASNDTDVNSYLANLSENELLQLLNSEYGGNIEAFKNDIAGLEGLNLARPEVPTYESIYNDILNGNDAMVNDYLADLQADEDRQTDMFRQQLSDNKNAFDDYRSQILSNQYQQNAQLMQTVGSEMSKARRNAIEAGASAGMRMAENVNTMLSMQNKQSQLSLETSNQLAQQLLNQRQAAAGIRGSYNDMLSQNAAERRNFKQQAAQDRYEMESKDYDTKYNNWSSQFDSSNNALASGYQGYLEKNANKKSQSQYN